MTTIEFAGLPGAGKSHWSAYAVSELRAAGREVSTPRASLRSPLPVRWASKGLNTVRALAALPAGALAQSRTIVAEQPTWWQGVRRAVQWLDTQTRLSAATGITILDEGAFQALWSIGLAGNREAVVDVLRHGEYHRGDLVVVVEVPPPVALQRLDARDEGHRRLSGLTASERLEMLERGEQLLGSLAAEWGARHGEDSLVRIAGERPEGVADQLRDLLSRPSLA